MTLQNVLANSSLSTNSGILLLPWSLNGIPEARKSTCFFPDPERKRSSIHLPETVNILLKSQTLIKNKRDAATEMFVVQIRFEINYQVTSPSFKADCFHTTQLFFYSREF